MLDELIDTAIFKDVSYSAMQEISAFCEAMEFNEGESMISENDADYDIFILTEGALEVVSKGAKSTSEEVVISKADCNVYGEITWLTRNKRTATLRCHGAVSAIKIDGEELFKYMEANPAIGFEIMRNTAVIVAERLENTNTLIKQILWNNNI